MVNGKLFLFGCLNDLCYIIYKFVDVFWCWVCKSLGLMMCEGLLKENIDGEVFIWVYNCFIVW